MESILSSYRELAPSPRLREQVECVWIGIEAMTERSKRVLPDGCADIIYARSANSAHLFVVGPMTRFRHFPQSAGGCSVGIRFRPGMWGDVLRVNGPEMADGMVPLAALWGRRADQLRRDLESLDQPHAFASVLANAIPGRSDGRSPLERAVGALELSGGRASLDTVAYEAGFSARQFRRRCIRATGFSPKLLGRILRFRHATELVLPMSGRHAELAYECGYADQSHLIADFQEFAGQTPCEMAAEFAAG